jgi:hypothetical protein
MRNIEKFDFRKLAENWPSALVARSEIGRFTGGVVSSSLWQTRLTGEGLSELESVVKRPTLSNHLSDGLNSLTDLD